MSLIQTRRRLISGVAAAGAAGLVRMPRALSADGPPETTMVRLAKQPVICFAPQYVCEQLLRAEGFIDVRYVDLGVPGPNWQELGRGRIDFASDLSLHHVIGIDQGAPITIVSGVHGGCYELFVQGDIRSIRDLKGKRVGESGGAELISMMAAWVGLDPQKDLVLVTDPAANPMELFAQGKLDAHLAFPPEVQELRARKVGHVILRTAVDRPWSQYFCCALAGNREYVARNPIATKRVIRAFLKAAELCVNAPEQAARLLVDGGYTPRYDYALQAINEVPYDQWRDYNPEDTIRFYALRLHDLGMIKRDANRIIAEATDFRSFEELKRELKT
jgi:NitT/TauT family transport system substrate-binding protein